MEKTLNITFIKKKIKRTLKEKSNKRSVLKMFWKFNKFLPTYI